MLQDVFKKDSISQVLDFLLDEPSYDFSQSDVKRETELSWKTVHEVFPLLEKLGLILPTRIITRAKLYKINKESKIFRLLQKLDLEVSAIINEELVEKEEKTMMNVKN